MCIKKSFCRCKMGRSFDSLVKGVPVSPLHAESKMVHNTHRHRSELSKTTALVSDRW